MHTSRANSSGACQALPHRATLRRGTAPPGARSLVRDRPPRGTPRPRTRRLPRLPLSTRCPVRRSLAIYTRSGAYGSPAAPRPPTRFRPRSLSGSTNWPGRMDGTMLRRRHPRVRRAPVRGAVRRRGTAAVRAGRRRGPAEQRRARRDHGGSDRRAHRRAGHRRRRSMALETDDNPNHGFTSSAYWARMRRGHRARRTSAGRRGRLRGPAARPGRARRDGPAPWSSWRTHVVARSLPFVPPQATAGRI